MILWIPIPIWVMPRSDFQGNFEHVALQDIALPQHLVSIPKL